MAVHNYVVNIGDQVFLDQGTEEIGAVRQIAKDHIVAYIENAGDFRIDGPAVKAVHSGKVILDPDKLDERLLDAIAHAHEHEV